MPLTHELTNHDLANCLIDLKQRLVQTDEIDFITEAITRLRSKNWKSDKIDREEIIWAVARGWCHPNNESKTMDTGLAYAIVDEVMEQLNK